MCGWRCIIHRLEMWLGGWAVEQKNSIKLQFESKFCSRLLFKWTWSKLKISSLSSKQKEHVRQSWSGSSNLTIRTARTLVQVLTRIRVLGGDDDARRASVCLSRTFIQLVQINFGRELAIDMRGRCRRIDSITVRVNRGWVVWWRTWPCNHHHHNRRQLIRSICQSVTRRTKWMAGREFRGNFLRILIPIVICGVREGDRYFNLNFIRNSQHLTFVPRWIG